MTPNRPNSGNQGTGFYVWSAPAGSAVVHLHLAVVDRLGREIREAAMGALRHKAVCGLLLGRVIPETDAIIVEDSLALPCSDVLSPASYFLNTGKAVLTEKLSQWQPGPDKRLWAVGYYQHQKDGGLTVRDDEAELFEREFRPPGKVMLLTALSAGGQPIAGFFPRVAAGEIPRHPPLSFPLSRMELRGAAERAAAPPPAFQPEEPPRARRRFTQYDAIRLTSVGIVLVALAMLAIGRYTGSNPAPRGERRPELADPSAADLGLAIEGAPDRVIVRWNSAATAVATGVEGTLTVNDGGATQILVLKRPDLTAGRLVYFPSGNHVSFELRVTTRDGRQATARAAFLAARRPHDGKP
jgi:hypothetical protein